MDAISYILGGFVLVYTIVYAFKGVTPIVRYQKCVKNGKLKTVTGVICEKVDAQNKAIRGAMVNLCLPKFEFEVGGEKRYYQSTVGYQNASIGQSAEIGYCERTGEAWVIQDIPAMKSQLAIRVALMVALVALLVITDVML